MLHMRRGRRRSHQLDAEVRLTNLIDVAFVLLIIFMITAPILQGGIEVKLPEAEAMPLESNDALVITLTKEGRIYFNKSETTLDELPSLVKAYSDGNQPVSLKADALATHEQVMKILGRLYRAGITDVALPVEPEGPR